MSDIVSLSSLSNAALGSQVQLEHARATGEPSTAPSNGSVSSGSGEDSIVLSNTAVLIQHASSAGSADRASRVEQLKQQVQNGQYSVDPGALGNALIGGAIAGE
jgi:flagellar biosynthesis anti-sigma factor FlgM